MVEEETSLKEYVKFSLLIAVLVAAAWWFASWDGEVLISDWIGWFMGLFFLTFGAFKLVDYELFVEMFRIYDIPAQRYRWYAWAYPFIEIFLGMLYLTNSWGALRDLATIVVMGVGAYGVWQHIKTRRKRVRCACLGNVIKLPLTHVTLGEDAAMGLMAFVMLLPL